MGYSGFSFLMLTSAKLLLFHYIYGPLIQYPPAENGEKTKYHCSRDKEDKKGDKGEKIHN